MADAATPGLQPPEAVQSTGWTAPARLAIGFAQGLALWLLYLAADGSRWPATVPEFFLPLLLTLIFIPVLLLAGIGRMRGPSLAAWAVAALAMTALMGWHEAAGQSRESLGRAPYINGPMPLFAAVALFIGHHFVASADAQRAWRVSYPVYFDAAWKSAVQLGLAIAFVATFWILLHLGAALFRVIGLSFLEDLIRERWFAIPTSALVFSLAIHLTDVSDGLIRGVRAVGLMLLSWLLLLMTLLAAGFLAALPFTGLKGLWDTGSGTTLVLAAAAALILLVNAAYQTARTGTGASLALRTGVRIAAFLLAPLVFIAFYGLLLRIGQHSLTPERIIALACAAVGAVFALGYAWASAASFRRGSAWMRPLEPTTLIAALAALALILALFSPLLDPARLSAAHQAARLERGEVAPDRFDYDFLRYDSGRAGQAALARLAGSQEPEIRRRARAALDRPAGQRDAAAPAALSRDLRFEVLTPGVQLPQSFVNQYDQLAGVLQNCAGAAPCPTRLIDLDRDGDLEILVGQPSHASVFRQEADGRWAEWGIYLPACPDAPPDLSSDFRTGPVERLTPELPGLIINGVRTRIVETTAECRARATSTRPEPDPG